MSNTKDKYKSIFWKKAHLLCLIFQRNFSEANFVFDVMASQNLLDDTFQTLIDKVLNEKKIDDYPFKDKSVSPINLVLLDITQYPINYQMIRDFSDKLIDKALKLNGTVTGGHGIGKCGGGGRKNLPSVRSNLADKI